jgi:hypothetical protein
VAKLLSDLLTALCPELESDPYADASMWDLLGKVWELLATAGRGDMQKKEQRTTLAVLLIVNHLCILISCNQLALPSSEHVNLYYDRNEIVAKFDDIFTPFILFYQIL